MRRVFSPIAVDVGSHAIKLLQVAWANQELRVVAAQSVPAAGQPAEPAWGGYAPVWDVAAMRRALNSGGFAGRRAALVLPDRAMRAKNLRLPHMPEAEMAAAVRFEAAERFGGLQDEDETRFIPVGTVRSGRDEQHEVVALVADGQATRRYLLALGDLGLTAVSVDAPLCAAFRPFRRFLQRQDDAEQANAFIDIGFGGSRLVVARGPSIAFVKSFEAGGALWNQRLVEALGESCVDAAAAAKLRQAVQKGEWKGADATRVAECLAPSVDQLGKEIGLCLRYYAVTFRGARPDSVTCIGGESNNAWLLTRLSDAVGLPVRAAFPFRTVAVPEACSFLNEAGGIVWTVALGAAMGEAASPDERHVPGLVVSGVA